MGNNFEKAVNFVLSWEGGYSNNIHDKGCETNFGITKKSYPDLDIRNLTIEKAKKIYHKDYWLKANCHIMDYPLDIVMFNCAVNCGVSRANKILKNSCSWQDYLFNQLKFYSGLANYNYFGRGWINRTLGLYHLIKERG